MYISVVIPCFNAIDKIGRCMASLKKISCTNYSYEVLFIDDCSSDGTSDLVRQTCSAIENWHFIQLESNSGSPSRPRNEGIRHAKGKYIFFLDCDDEILPNALLELTELAEQTKACIVRSELLSYDGTNITRMNQIKEWKNTLSRRERIELIIGEQSTTAAASFIRAEILKRNNIRWPEHIRMGEDTIFLAHVLDKAEVIEYLAVPTYIYFKIPSLTPASTQRYGRRELADHLKVWRATQALLKPSGVDYIKIRLCVGLRAAIEALIFRGRRDLDENVFSDFAAFLSEYWNTVVNFSYSRRISDIIQAAKEGDFQGFIALSRPRLLIAGHDLKFIEEAIPYLCKSFDIRLDEWTGHTSHDEKKSKKLLEWADYIWCEWMLGNAEWYASNKKPTQKLVIRIHRMELGRSHGEVIDINAIDAIIAVSSFFFERILERFPNLQRNKLRLIHNYVLSSDYKASDNHKKLHTLAMIGILPSKKGFKNALILLNKIREKDERFCLKVFGKSPLDLPWIARDTVQMAYFKECWQFIADNDLGQFVEFVGHVNIKKSLADHGVGYVLSMSESELGLPGFECFHLAIADGFCSGAVGLIKHWPGAEMVWPSEYICKTEHELADKILSLSKSPSKYYQLSQSGGEFVKSRYDVRQFSTAVDDLFKEL